MKLPFKLSHPLAIKPAFGSDGAACFDLTSTSRAINGNTAIYGTGLHFDIPQGYMLEVYSRSGHGFNDDLMLCNSVGVVDPDYTGEVKVKLTYTGPPTNWINWPHVGDRVAQAKLTKLVKTDLIEVEEIKKETARGENGFGSTGR